MVAPTSRKTPQEKMKNYKTIEGFTFEVLKQGSKRASEKLTAFNCAVGRHGLRGLFDCYDKASAQKVASYNKIIDFCAKIGGYSAIIGFNSCAYSIGVYDKKNRVLYYFTAYNQYLIKD